MKSGHIAKLKSVVASGVIIVIYVNEAGIALSFVVKTEFVSRLLQFNMNVLKNPHWPPG